MYVVKCFVSNSP